MNSFLITIFNVFVSVIVFICVRVSLFVFFMAIPCHVMLLISCFFDSSAALRRQEINVSKLASVGVTCPRQLKLELKTTQIKKETFMQEGQVSVKCGPLEIVNPARPKWNAHILYPGRFCIGMQNSAHTVTFRSGPIFQP